MSHIKAVSVRSGGGVWGAPQIHPMREAILSLVDEIEAVEWRDIPRETAGLLCLDTGGIYITPAWIRASGWKIS